VFSFEFFFSYNSVNCLYAKVKLSLGLAVDDRIWYRYDWVVGGRTKLVSRHWHSVVIFGFSLWVMFGVWVSVFRVRRRPYIVSERCLFWKKSAYEWDLVDCSRIEWTSLRNGLSIYWSVSMSKS
jgi:hypothetical protein